MNISRTFFIPGVALAMAAVGYGASAQRALPSVNTDKGEAKVTAQKVETRAEKWKSLGIGKYRDNIMHSYRLMGNWYPEWEVEIMESEDTPGYYKVVNPYKNCPFSGWGQANNDPQWCILINAEDPEGVYIPDWYAGFDFTDPDSEQVGPLMLWSQAHDYYEYQYGDLELAKKEGLCGRLKNGAITFPPGTILVQIAPNYEEKNVLWKPTNKDGMWRVKLPGAPDLDVSLTYNFSTDGTIGKLTAGVSVDKDVEKVLGAVVNNSDAAAVYDDIVSGKVEAQEIKQTGEYTFDITKNGKYTVMIVPYYNGEALEPVYAQGEFIVADADWVSCAEPATWSDGFLYGLESNFIPWYESTGNVEVQYSTKEAGVIRLVDPFGPDSYQWSNKYDSSEKHYMVFHLADPQKVYLDMMSPIGLDIGFGSMDVWCKVMRLIERKEGGEEISDEEIEKWYGKLEGNVVTFPTGGLYTRFPVVTPSWYASNFNSSFRLELPEEVIEWMSGVGKVEMSGEAGSTTYYTLQGVKVNSASLAPGIYVKVSDGKVSKVIVK